MATAENLILINKALETRDYLPGDFDKKTFVDVQKWLMEKYPDRIIESLRAAGAEPSLDRTTFKFEYIDPAGQRLPLGLEMTVGEAKKLTKEVFWLAEPYGG
jgi:hypothetical protein